MYEELKKKYDKGYITKATLKGWVRIERKVKGRGITEEQYEQITGEIYCYDKSSSVLVLHILCKPSSKMGVSLTFTEED